MPDRDTVNGNGSAAEAIAGDRPSAASQEGKKRGVPVTAQDLSLREDICFQIFGNVGPLVRDFSCAWDHKVLMHGRMYVTERRMCFYANFFGLEAKMSLRHEDVARCTKGNSAIFIPNAIVVQDKSGKDFVFRNFWERDECHSLLDKLRVDVHKAEEMLNAAAASAAAALALAGDSQEEGDASPTSSSHGNALPLVMGDCDRLDRSRASSVSGLSTAQRSTSACPFETSNGRRHRPPSPHPDEARPSSVPPPSRALSATMHLSSLPASPSSPQRAMSMSTRAASGTASEAATAALARVPATKSAAAAAVNGDRRPTNLGLAVVGAEHDIPSPRASFGSSRRLQSLSSQRSSPAHEATRRKSPDPSTRPAIDGGVGGTIYARNPSGGSGGGGGAAASEDTADEDKDKRRSSRLWKIIWDAGRGGVNGGEDPKANREAMEKAVAAGRGHVKVATAELSISVQEFYERFFADNAPFGLPDFHMSRGDWEVQAGEWQETCKGQAVATASPNAQDGANGGGGKAEGGDKTGDGHADCGVGDAGGARRCGGGLTRAIRFKTPLHITFMSSPGQVRTLKQQRARFFGSAGYIVDTITSVEDRIPLSDNFHVEDRWIIRPAGKDGRACSATVTWRCVWHKFTVIKGIIEGKAREDVRSFNMAFLEGMRAHLKEVEGKAPRHRQSLRESLLSAAGRGGSARRIREESSSGLSNPPFDSADTATSDVAVEDDISSNMAGFAGRHLPAIRVMFLCLVMYLSISWVFRQTRTEGDQGPGVHGRDHAAVAKGDAGSQDEIMRLYAEWGRSSLALLDVRAETLRLSAEVAQLRLYGSAGAGRGGRGRHVDGDGWKRDEGAVQLSLQEIEDKVMDIAKHAEDALAALDYAAAQIRDAKDCNKGEAVWSGAPCEQACVPDV